VVEDKGISRKSANEGRKVGKSTNRPPLPPQEIFLLMISVRGCVDLRAIGGLEDLCQRKIPMTPLGTETATCRIGGQCLKQPRHRVEKYARNTDIGKLGCGGTGVLIRP
jgi:hypothetical protein